MTAAGAPGDARVCKRGEASRPEEMDVDASLAEMGAVCLPVQPTYGQGGASPPAGCDPSMFVYCVWSVVEAMEKSRLLTVL